MISTRRIAVWTLTLLAASGASAQTRWTGPIVQYADEPVVSGDCVNCGPVCDCNACDSIGPTTVCDIDRVSIDLPVFRIDWNRFEFGAGSTGVTGPITKLTDQNGGQFGYQQHVNESRDLRRWLGIDIAAQLGVRLTQLNLGDGVGPAESRHQTFVTGGLFRRVDYGLQYGVAVDYLNDRWIADFEVVQIRGEVAWVATPCHSFGANFAFGSSDDVTDFSSAGVGFQTVATVDQVRGFYRYQMSPVGGAWTTYLGGTDDDHLILSSEVDLPVTEHLGLRVGSTYFASAGDARLPESQNGGWNLSIGMTFRPGFGTKADRYRRPLFDVADNGSLLLTRR